MHKSHTLLIVYLGLSVVREDHSWKVVAERSSGGLIVISSPLKHLQHHPDGHRPTFVSEVH